MSKIVSKRRMEITVLLVLFLSIIPILYLSKYNRPSADDYMYSWRMHRVYIENGFNIVDAVKELITTEYDLMDNCEGEYSMNVLLAIQPGIFGYKYYSLSPIIIFTFIFASFCFFINTVIKEYLLINEKRSWIPISLCFIFFYLECLPEPVQGLYWFNGSAAYMCFLSLAFVNFGIILKYFNEVEKKKKCMYIILSVILSFIISGGNYIPAYFNICILTLLGFYMVYKKEYPMLTSWVSAVVGFIVCITSNGTNKRQQVFGDRKGIAETIIESIKFTLQQVHGWADISLFLFILLITPFLIKLVLKSNITFKFSILIGLFIVAFGIVSSTYCLPYYGMGRFGSGRLHNMIWTVFWIFTVIIWFYTLGISKSYLIKCEIDTLLSKNYKLICVSQLIFIFGILIWGNLTYRKSTTIMAVKELADGTAKQYAYELDEREKKLDEAYGKDVTVKVDRLTIKPELLFFDDIDGDNNWNATIAKYYNFTTLELND